MHLALKIRGAEIDAREAGTATKVCFSCDPDNPLRVARATCPSCGGSGQQELEAKGVVIELEAARTSRATEAAAPAGRKQKPIADDDADLYLEY